MKSIGFILAIYILALNFAPCEDNHEDGESISSSVVEHDSGSDHEHSDLELCSPFCECNCCQIHVTNDSLAEFNIISNEISTEIYLHLDSFGKDIAYPLLHPPRA